jgi:aryl carrier-like protein
VIEKVLPVWETVPHRPVEEGADLFLDPGGDSVKALELTDAASDESGADVGVGHLFEAPTAASLVELTRRRPARIA